MYLVIHSDKDNPNALLLSEDLLLHGFEVLITDSVSNIIGADLVLSVHADDVRSIFVIKDDQSFSPSSRMAGIVNEHIKEHYNCNMCSNREFGRSYSYVFRTTIPTVVILHPRLNGRRASDKSLGDGLLTISITEAVCEYFSINY